MKETTFHTVTNHHHGLVSALAISKCREILWAEMDALNPEQYATGSDEWAQAMSMKRCLQGACDKMRILANEELGL